MPSHQRKCGPVYHARLDIIKKLRESPFNTNPIYCKAGPPIQIETVFSEMDRTERGLGRHVYFYGFPNNLKSLRLKTFKKCGISCVFCGLTAGYFSSEIQSGNLSINRFYPERPLELPFHLNLYGLSSSGKEVLFTKDHIIPRSKGGGDRLCNLQTACVNCNHEKGNDASYKGKLNEF